MNSNIAVNRWWLYANPVKVRRLVYFDWLPTWVQICEFAVNRSFVSNFETARNMADH